MKSNKLILPVILWCLCQAMVSMAQVSGVQKVTSMEGITEYKLEKNGFRFLLFPDNSKPTITVNITYMVGSRHEGYGETGMAHLLEHLVFKGTPKHPNIPAELTSHGARPNGTTWYDRTNYFETFAATDENLEWALDLESDRMINSYIAKKDLESEMTVVRNEFERGENNPLGILGERVESTAYLWHSYGKSTIGARSDIENVPIERLQAFYKKYYQPDNAILVVAGKIDEVKTINLVKKYFENIPVPERSGSNLLYPTYTEEPVQDGERKVFLERVGDIQGIQVAYHIPPGAHKDNAAIGLLLSMLTDNPGGLFYKKLIETKKAASVQGFAFQLKEPSLAQIAVEVPMDKSLDDAYNTLFEMLDNMGALTFTQEELDRQKQRSYKFWEMMFTNVERVGTGLSSSIAMGDWRLIFYTRDLKESVTLEDIKRVANTYFKASNRTIGVFKPTKEPDRAEIAFNVDLEDIFSKYKGKEAMSQGEAFDPSPANIDSRTVTTNLSKDLELAMLPKETRGDVVTATMTFRAGDLNSLTDKGTIAQLTSGLLMEGTKTRSKQQIKDELDRLKASVNVSGNGNTVNVRISTVRDNLPAVITLVSDILKNPVFPEDQLDISKNIVISMIESQKSDPQAIAMTELERLTSPYKPGDPRYTETFDESIEAIKKVSINDVREFHKNFYGASTGSITVVGDFDKKQIETQLKKEFGSWKSKSTFKRLDNQYMANPSTVKTFNTPDKANSTYLSKINIPMSDADKDYAALTMANFIFGGGFLNSRLATRIRQKDGLSYTVRSSFNASALDKNASWQVFAISAPENTTKVHIAVKEEIERVHKEGFTQQELDEARKGYLQSREVARAQDGTLVAMLNANLYYDRTMKFEAALDEAIKNLTLDQLNQVFKKYIDANKMTTIMAGDFEKPSATKP